MVKEIKDDGVGVDETEGGGKVGEETKIGVGGDEDKEKNF